MIFFWIPNYLCTVVEPATHETANLWPTDDNPSVDLDLDSFRLKYPEN